MNDRSVIFFPVCVTQRFNEGGTIASLQQSFSQTVAPIKCSLFGLGNASLLDLVGTFKTKRERLAEKPI